MKLKYISLFLLGIITISVHLFIEHYQVVGDDDLLVNGHFDDGLKGWHIHRKNIPSDLIHIEHGRLFLSSDSTGLTLSQSLTVPDGQFVKVSAQASVSNVVAGDKSWQKAKIYLVSQVNGNKFWGQKHNLFSIAGSHGWAAYQDVFAIHPGAEKLILGIQIPKGSGAFILDDITVFDAVISPLYQFLIYVLMVLWGGLFIWMVLPLLQNHGNFLLFISALAVLSLMVVPGNVKKDILTNVTDLVKQEIPVDKNITDIPDGQVSFLSMQVRIDKAGHFFAFFVLTLIVFLFKKKVDIRLFLIMAGFAAITEILQILSVNRSPQLGDFAINLAGVSLAFLLVYSGRIIRAVINRDHYS